MSSPRTKPCNQSGPKQMERRRQNDEDAEEYRAISNQNGEEKPERETGKNQEYLYEFKTFWRRRRGHEVLWGKAETKVGGWEKNVTLRRDDGGRRITWMISVSWWKESIGRRWGRCEKFIGAGFHWVALLGAMWGSTEQPPGWEGPSASRETGL